MSDDDHQLKAQLLALNQGPPPVVKDAPATGWYSNVKTNKSRATTKASRDVVCESSSSRRLSELFGVSKRESFGEVYGGEIDDDDDDVSGIV